MSLTVNEVDGAKSAVNLIPHALAVTTLGRFEPGRRVHLEIDMRARCLERLLSEQAA
jgi:riboflavin synthase